MPLKQLNMMQLLKVIVRVIQVVLYFGYNAKFGKIPAPVNTSLLHAYKNYGVWILEIKLDPKDNQ